MNEKVITVYRRIAERILDYGSHYWNNCTIYTSRNRYPHLIPEILAVIIAEEANGTVILDANKIQKEVLLELLEDLDKKPLIFEFSTSNISIPCARKIKIGIEKIREGAKLFSKIIAAYNVNNELIEELENEIMCMDDVNELCDIIMMFHMPPKIREKIKMELKEYVKNKNKMDLVMNIAGVIGRLIVNPIIVAPRGIEIIQKVIKNVDKRDIESRELKDIVELVKPEVLSEIVEEGEESLNEFNSKKGFKIVLCNLRNELYKPFQLFLIWSLLSSVDSEGEVIVLSDANEISKLNYLKEKIEATSRSKDLKIIYMFRDYEEFNGWIGDKSVIFDIKFSKLLEMMKDEDLTSIIHVIRDFPREPYEYGSNEINFIMKYMDGPWRNVRINLGDEWRNRVKRILVKMIEMMV